jgi:hypothetical protein
MQKDLEGSGKSDIELQGNNSVKNRSRIMKLKLDHNVSKLLQRQIRYNGKIFGHERGRCNEG